MIPNSVLSSQVESAAFLPPKQGVIKTALVDYCQGALGIGNTTYGLSYQTWQITTDGGSNVIFTPLTAGSPTTVLTVGGQVITWVAGTFDQNMNPFVAYTVGSVANGNLAAYFYWYNSAIPGYQTTELPTGANMPFCDIDDRRPLNSNNADIILSYVNNDNLYFRAQRENYATEHLLAAIGATNFCTQAGMNVANRFQWQFQSLTPSVVNLFTKFAPAGVFKPVMVANAAGIEPRIWVPHENTTVTVR